MKAKAVFAFLASSALLLAVGCQDTPVTYDGDLAPSFANVHLKGGKNAAPTYQDLGVTLEASGSLSGLGMEDLVIFLTAEADVVAVCQNNGGNQAPGQNPAPITVSGAQPIPADQIKNGNLSFTIWTDAPESPIPGAPDCPNSNWDEIIVDLIFHSATISVEQPLGEVVWTRTDGLF